MAMTANRFTIPASVAVVNGYLKMKSATCGVEDITDIGIFEYVEPVANTTTTIPAGGAWTKLKNAGTDATTYKVRPDSVTEVYDTSLTEFDFSELGIADSVNIRIDCEITSTVVDTEFEIKLVQAEGAASERDIFYHQGYHPTASTKRISIMNGVFIRDADVRNNPATFYASSALGCSIKVSSYYCQVFKRGWVQP